jgi:NHL repeat.
MRTDLKSGLIKTVAGTGESGWTGDGGEALAACLNEPKGLTLDREGNLFIADSENHIVRKIDKKTRRIKTVAAAFRGLNQGRHPPRPFRWLSEEMTILLPKAARTIHMPLANRLT